MTQVLRIESTVRRQRIISLVCSVICSSSAAGSGDVTGPASSVSGNLPVFADTSGKVLSDSGSSPSSFQPASSVLTQYIAGVTKVFYQSGASSSVNATTNEIVLKFVLIPANTIQANDRVRMVGTWTKPGANGSVGFFFRVNTTLPVVGSQPPSGGSIIGQILSGATIKFTQMERAIMFKDSAGAQIVILNTNTVLTTDMTTLVAGKTDLTIDPTVNQYLMWTLQLANGSDTGTLEHVTIQIFR